MPQSIWSDIYEQYEEVGMAVREVVANAREPICTTSEFLNSCYGGQTW
jgi:hypothetical protein